MSSLITKTPLLLRLVHHSTIIVNIAGEIARNILQTGKLEIVDKGTDDLQTKADRCVQKYIVGTLANKYPNMTIIGEEPEESEENFEEFLKGSEFLTEQSSTQFSDILKLQIPDSLHAINEEGLTAWIDPLDGTGEFTKGLVEHVTILVGFAWNGNPVAGIINQPFVNSCNNGSSPLQGRTLWGISTGSFNSVGSFPDIEFKQSSHKRVVTTTRTHSTEETEGAIKALEPDEILRVGGSGFKSLLLIDGVAHGYVFLSNGTKKWDTCAPEAILRASGGQLTDVNGKSYNYNKDTQHANAEGLLATAPSENHAIWVKKISDWKSTLD